MHSKTKSTLSGLAAVTAFVLGSALLGEPLPAADQAAATQQIDAAPVAQAEPGAAGLERSAREGNRRRLHLTMPYFAIGQLLPRGQES